MKKLLLVIILILSVVFIITCSKSSPTGSNNNSGNSDPIQQNRPPSRPNISVGNSTLESGNSTNLSATASDPDGDPITYSWNATGGSFNSTTQSNVVWTAPTVSSSQTYTITLTVRDNHSASNNNSVNINVNPAQVDTETFSGTSNSNGEYTFHSDVYNQDITVQVNDNYGTPLSNKKVEGVSTENNLIVIVSDPSKNYYPNIVIEHSSNLKSLGKPKIVILTVALAAYTAYKTIRWLIDDPPKFESTFDDDGKLEKVCVTGDLEDVVNTLSLVFLGVGGVLEVGKTVANSLNIASEFGQVIDLGVNEMTGALLDANFDMDRDYTYCYYLPGSEEIPLPAVYIQDVGPPVQTTYSLNISVSGNGTVVESPYSQYYNEGESVQLLATPSQDWRFYEWQGDLSGDTNPTSITMNSDKSVTAVFTEDNSDTGTMTDIDGNVYQTVQIGNQVWMAENLKVTRYRNGDQIPNVTGPSEWGNMSSGAYCSYDNDDSNVSIYGRLYNWHAVNDPRRLAPTGWHVPSDAEWKTLEKYLGMSQTEADAFGYRGTDEGNKLKSTSGWYWDIVPQDGNGTNESGFSALPGGIRGYTDYFYYLGNEADYWTATERSDNYAWFRSLTYQRSDVYRVERGKQEGFSIRCVKD